MYNHSLHCPGSFYPFPIYLSREEPIFQKSVYLYSHGSKVLITEFILSNNPFSRLIPSCQATFAMWYSMEVISFSFCPAVSICPSCTPRRAIPSARIWLTARNFPSRWNVMLMAAIRTITMFPTRLRFPKAKRARRF